MAGTFFEVGMKLEVVDKMRICQVSIDCTFFVKRIYLFNNFCVSQVRVATIQEITGRRLFLTYDDVDTDDNGFWCHEESSLIHPVSHTSMASRAYLEYITSMNTFQFAGWLGQKSRTPNCGLSGVLQSMCP
jgi:hypothetical protein